MCACNQVLDEVARRALDAPFDEGGAAACRGRPDAAAADMLYEILTRQRRRGTSLGSDAEPIGWVADKGLDPDDLAASAASAVARCIGDAIGENDVDEVYVAGGGARNAALVGALSTARLTDDLGIAVQAREAMAMAVLGALAADRVTITLPQVTGASGPSMLAGAWYLP